MPVKGAVKSTGSYVPHDRLTDSCHRCGQKGHWAPDCPTKKLNVNAKHFGLISPMDRLALDRTGSASKDTVDLPSALELASQYVVDMYVNGELVSVFVDSGASDSLVDPSFVDSRGLQSLPNQTQVRLGHADSYAVSPGSTLPLPCVFGSRSVDYSFFIMPLAAGYPFVIGRDLMHRFGFRLAFSPFLDCMATSQELSDEELQTNPKLDPNKPSSVTSRISIPGDVESSLMSNTVITTRCTHPDACIPLDTGDAPPVFQRQYRVAQTCIEKMTSIVDGWLWCNLPCSCRLPMEHSTAGCTER